MDRTRVPLVPFLLAFIIAAAAIIVDAKGATMNPKPVPVVPSSNVFELTGSFVRPPLCVYVGERTPYTFEVRNISTRQVQGHIRLSGFGGLYGIRYSFARPSLRGSAPYNLYWDVVLRPGQSTQFQLNVVIPDWVSGAYYGPVSFGFGYNLVIPGERGSQYIGTNAEFCDPPVGGK